MADCWYNANATAAPIKVERLVFMLTHPHLMMFRRPLRCQYRTTSIRLPRGCAREKTDFSATFGKTAEMMRFRNVLLVLYWYASGGIVAHAKGLEDVLQGGR